MSFRECLVLTINFTRNIYFFNYQFSNESISNVNLPLRIVLRFCRDL